MTGPDDWSSVPSRGSGHVDDVPDGLEARRDPGTPASGGVGGRVHGRPAPQYGEYAPEGWVNPVLVEQERREQDDRTQALRDEAAEAAVRDRRTAGSPDDRAGATPVSGRHGASPLDFALTVGLLAVGLWSVLGSFAVSSVASATRAFVERHYTDLSDPAALSSAVLVRAVVLVVAFVLVAWWSLRRLRARRWTFWVPLVGGVVGSALGSVPVLVVVFQDPQVQAYMHRVASGG